MRFTDAVGSYSQMQMNNFARLAADRKVVTDEMTCLAQMQMNNSFQKLTSQGISKGYNRIVTDANVD